MSDPGHPCKRGAFRWAYGAGLVLCVLCPAALEILLGRIPKLDAVPPEDFARQLGYTFTGLLLCAGAFLSWRSGKVRSSFSAVPPEGRPRIILRETLLYSTLCTLGALFGLACHALDGPLAERHARTFIALSPIMFLVFVPRLDAWKKAGIKDGPGHQA